MGPSVLLVDDNIDILSQAEAYLVNRGCRVLATASPIGVGAMVLRHRPDVAVVDVMMPGLDGGTLVDVLDAQQALERPHVIFYSAIDEEQLHQLTRSRVRTSYVSKVDGLPALFAAISRQVAR
jgi:CheY-like chemotaxis protein